MTITHASGQTFQSQACGTCGARDSNPVTLAAHELMHRVMSDKLSMLRGPYLGVRRSGRRGKPPAKCLDCDFVGRLVKGRCQRDYQRDKNNRRRNQTTESR